ncbi:MAG: prolipoprotein diacylglyceryl transferase [Candidatus Azobacteroides sp.]|nr:prolipoprotein diacylglyceryl transferase [Candidatus Azobacteroides sp.]
MAFAFIDWTADPVAFTIPFIDKEVRWYGLAFALGFMLGLWIVSKIWKHEKLDNAWLDKLFVYVFVGTVVGARLGHCLFYNPQYYLANPLEIFKIWEGGLASHGGTLGILIAVYIYSKRVTHKSMLWTLDRLVVPVGFVAALIRLANLMNHEIYGHPTNLPWAFRFITNLSAWEAGKEPIFSLPSHPTQIYEAICYAITGFICLWLYWKKDAYKRQGLIFGVFFIGIFVSRFFIEFFKNVQEDFESGWILDMGQLLSIPFIIVGIWFVYKGLKTPIPVEKTKNNLK